MRLSVALTLGIPVAALALTATALGPDRLSNLRCHVVGCSAVQRVERLCEVAASVAPLPPELRAAAGADALEGHWPTEAQRALWAALHEGRPGQADDVLLDVLEAEGERAMRCPALGVTLNAPVAITPARVVVQGRTLLRLEDGRIPERYLGAMGLDIAGLADALGYHPDGSAVRVSAPSEAAFELLTQIVHTLGRAGVPKVQVALRGEVPRRFELDLPAHGTCPECLADVPEVRLGPIAPDAAPLLAVLGRPEGAPPPRPDAAPHLLALPGDGDHVFVSQSMEATGPLLLVTAAPTRPLADLARALQAVLGPEGSARFDQVALALLDGRADGLGEDSQALPPPQDLRLATQASLRLRREQAALARGAAPSASSRERTRPAAARPAAEPAPLPASRTSTARITESLRPKLRGLRDCYERALKIDTVLAGKVTLRFDVDAEGRAQNVRLDDHSLHNPRVTRCIANRARHWRLPRPSDAPVTVSYPLVFTPAGT